MKKFQSLKISNFLLLQIFEEFRIWEIVTLSDPNLVSSSWDAGQTADNQLISTLFLLKTIILKWILDLLKIIQTMTNLHRIQLILVCSITWSGIMWCSNQWFRLSRTGYICLISNLYFLAYQFQPIFSHQRNWKNGFMKNNSFRSK